ncbi:MAG: hypothetical protein AB1331_01555 [Bacillota bacterium]
MVDAYLDDRIRTVSAAFVLAAGGSRYRRHWSSIQQAARDALMAAAGHPLVELMGREVGPERAFLAYGHVLQLSPPPSFLLASEKVPAYLYALPKLFKAGFGDLLVSFYQQADLPGFWKSTQSHWETAAVLVRQILAEHQVSQGFDRWCHGVTLKVVVDPLALQDAVCPTAPGCLTYLVGGSVLDRLRLSETESYVLALNILLEGIRLAAAKTVRENPAGADPIRVKLRDHGLNQAFVTNFPHWLDRVVELIARTIASYHAEEFLPTSALQGYLTHQDRVVGPGVIAALRQCLLQTSLYQDLDRGQNGADDLPLFRAVSPVL